MANKMSPSALRAKAKQILDLANQAEDKLYMKVGRMVEKELQINDSFSSNNADELKAEMDKLKKKIQKILGD